jgi:hypothetical protein
MPCTEPKKCWVYGTTEKGKPKYVFFNPSKEDPEYVGEEQKVPCGRCVSCQLDRSKEWATRAVHEAQMHSLNCFITLTYAPENLPENSSLEPEHLKEFIKKLRRKLSWRVRCYGNEKRKKPILPKGEKRERWYPHNSKNLKYLASGEYGSEEHTHHPHYHICLFGWDPLDKEYFFTNEHGDPVYKSRWLADIWDKGFITVGELNYRTAAYTARYTLKKIKEYGEKHRHEVIDYETGETNLSYREWQIKELMENKLPEFIRMSQGIGKTWYEKYKSDTYKDYVYVGKQKHKIPRYYDKQLEKEDINRYEKTKEERKLKAIELENNPNKPTNLQRDIVKKQKLKLLTRSL